MGAQQSCCNYSLPARLYRDPQPPCAASRDVTAFSGTVIDCRAGWSKLLLDFAFGKGEGGRGGGDRFAMQGTMVAVFILAADDVREKKCGHRQRGCGEIALHTVLAFLSCSALLSE